MKSFPESDWKKLRAIRDKALTRLCTKTLEGIQKRIARGDAGNDPHKTYLSVYRFIDDQDSQIAFLFNDWRRSRALRNLTGWVQAKIVEDEEFEAFSEQTKESVRELIKIRQIK
ncbi:MAG: hypothetical protein GY906_35165 [bacterium]|nr:hypothetical protein [bacterium]